MLLVKVWENKTSLRSMLHGSSKGLTFLVKTIIYVIDNLVCCANISDLFVHWRLSCLLGRLICRLLFLHNIRL